MTVYGGIDFNLPLELIVEPEKKHLFSFPSKPKRDIHIDEHFVNFVPAGERLKNPFELELLCAFKKCKNILTLKELNFIDLNQKYYYQFHHSLTCMGC